MDALTLLRFTLGTALLVYINCRRPLHRPIRPCCYVLVLLAFFPTCPVRTLEVLRSSITPAPTPPPPTSEWLSCSTPLKHHAISLVSNLTRECTDYWEACPFSATIRTAYHRSNPPRYESSPFDFVGGRGHVRSKLLDIHLDHQKHHLYEWASPTTSSHEKDVDAHADCLRPGSWWWIQLTTTPTRLLDCWFYRSQNDWARLIGQARLWRSAAARELDRLLEEYTELSEELIPQRMSLDEQYYDALESEHQRQKQKIATTERQRPHSVPLSPPLAVHDLQTRVLVALLSMAHSAGTLAWSQHRLQMVSTLAHRVSTLSTPRFSQLPPSANQLHNLSTTVAGLDSELVNLLEERADPAGTKVYMDAATAWMKDFFANLESKQQQQQHSLPSALLSSPLTCWGNEYPVEKYFRKDTGLAVT